MSSQSSVPLQRFLESLEAPITRREQLDNLDLSSLSQLRGAERDEAEARLVARLATDPDERVVRALATIPTATAKGALRDAIGRYKGGPNMVDSAAFEALLGLIARGEEPDPVAALMDALNSGGPRTRERAARALAEYDREDVVDGLKTALADPEYAVRRAAAVALLEASGLGEHAAVLYTRLWNLRHWLKLPYASVQRAALAELEQAVYDQRAGRLGPPPAEIPDNSPALDRFIDSMQGAPGEPPWPDSFDLEALSKLEGVERDGIALTLVLGLDKNDPRYPRALAAMRDPRGVDPLRAALDGAEGEMRDALVAALDELNQGPAHKHTTALA